MKNKSKINHTKKAKRLLNLEKHKAMEKSKYLRHKNMYATKAKNRKLFKLKAMPTWVDFKLKKEIRSYYILAKELQWLSNEPLHVDHIVPLKGTDVCGLHVPWNLQILTASENIRKSNRVSPQ